MLAPSNNPQSFVVQMSGAPGSGKSSLSKLLRPSLNAVIIDHDVIRSSLLENSEASFDKVAKQAYSLQWALAEDMMKQGHSVIIDSTCNFQTVLDTGMALAAKCGFAYWYVECCVNDIDLLDQRLRLRVPLKSQRTSVDFVPEAARNSRNDDDARTSFKNGWSARVGQ